MRRRNETIQSQLIDCAQQIECAEGVDAISIRRLAREANIATGTVYNYFESKQDVLLALTENYWKTALEGLKTHLTAEHFDGQLAQMIDYLGSKMTDCAELMMRSLDADAETGRARMASMQSALRSEIAERLRADKQVRPDVWSEAFSVELFAEFVFHNILSLLRRGQDDARALIAVVSRVLYQEGDVHDAGTDGNHL